MYVYIIRILFSEIGICNCLRLLVRCSDRQVQRPRHVQPQRLGERFARMRRIKAKQQQRRTAEDEEEEGWDDGDVEQLRTSFPQELVSTRSVRNVVLNFFITCIWLLYCLLQKLISYL
jgi:hypothetical protein